MVYGILFGLIAALGWGTIGLWIKPINLESIDLTAIRFAAGGIFLFLLNRPTRVNVKDLLKACLCGIILSMQFFATIVAFKALSNGQAVLLTNLYLLFLFLFLLPIFIKKKKIVIQILAWLITLFIGVYFIFGQGQVSSGYAVAMGILASFLWAIYSLFIEKFFPENPQQYLAYIFLSGGSVTLAISVIRGFAIPTVTPALVINLFILLGFSTILAHLCYVLAINRIGSFGASILSYFSILIGFIIDTFLLKQLLTQQLVGAFIVFVSLCFLLYFYDIARTVRYEKR